MSFRKHSIHILDLSEYPIEISSRKFSRFIPIIRGYTLSKENKMSSGYEDEMKRFNELSRKRSEISKLENEISRYELIVEALKERRNNLIFDCDHETQSTIFIDVQSLQKNDLITLLKMTNEDENIAKIQSFLHKDLNK